jgi:hypothetical protein
LAAIIQGDDDGSSLRGGSFCKYQAVWAHLEHFGSDGAVAVPKILFRNAQRGTIGMAPRVFLELRPSPVQADARDVLSVVEIGTALGPENV